MPGDAASGHGGGKAGGKGDAQQQQQGGGEKKRKETIIDLSKFVDKPVRVKFAGGRECSGILKGYDQLLNLVLDATTEYIRDPEDPYRLTEETRQIGLTVCRGPAVVLICPADTLESIANPFVPQE